MPINYKLYPPNWKTHLVPTVLKRANNCCEECGRKNGQLVRSHVIKFTRKGKLVYRREWNDDTEHNEAGKLVKVILTVAHLDNDSHNFAVKVDRLRALCQLCHLRLDAQFKANKRKAQNQLRSQQLQLQLQVHGQPSGV